MPFEKGNKGRPKGTKNVKTKQWESLADFITNSHAEAFNTHLLKLWNGTDEEKEKACQLWLRVLEYFKPKMSRVDYTEVSDYEPIQFIITKASEISDKK